MKRAPKARSLDRAELESLLQQLPGWSIAENKLHKTFRFNDFSEAFGFMTRVAMAAEVMNHHPEWRNVYDTVAIDLYRHSKNDITDLDVELATQIETILTSGKP